MSYVLNKPLQRGLLLSVLGRGVGGSSVIYWSTSYSNCMAIGLIAPSWMSSNMLDVFSAELDKKVDQLLTTIYGILNLRITLQIIY